MRKTFTPRLANRIGLACTIAVALLGCTPSPAPKPSDDFESLGAPVTGLKPDELRKFWQARELFKLKLTPEQGLGPLFNGESCYECHGQPGPVGGEGRDASSTNITVFARRRKGVPKAGAPLSDVIENLTIHDVDLFLTQGGPTLQRRSITTEFPERFPFQCQLDFEQIPKDAELVSPRHSPPLFGDGLIDNLPDAAIMAEGMLQQSNPALAGRPISAVDRFTEATRTSRFGWKDHNINLLNFTTTALNVEMGITTFTNHTENSPTFFGKNPRCLQQLIKYPTPNDNGKLLLGLTYFQALLAPPPRGPITEEVKKGEKIFNDLSCAFCHRPTWKTKADAIAPDPESPLPNIRWLKIDALSDKEFHPYSDFLVHEMGPGLADGIPQEGAKGGEWRTTPLWGLRFKKFLMHDGRTQDIEKAILLHGGQGQYSADGYSKLSVDDKRALLAFLKSL